MKSPYVKIALLFMAGAGLHLSCAQSETTDVTPTPMTGTGGIGTSSTGGTTATGGSQATGGNATGGTSSTGGTTGTGGAQATGGTTGTGGVLATGGTTGTGGMAGHSGGAGSNGTGGAGGGAAASFADVTALFAANCIGCHTGTPHTDLRAAGLYARIVNQNDTKAPCTAQKLIVPNNPAMSLISNKIKGTNLNGCGNRMPSGCTTKCLMPAQIATVDNWINAGAPM